MKKMCFILFLLCMVLSTVVHAESSSTADVQIEIEETKMHVPTEMAEMVQTGDKMDKLPYMIAMGMAGGVGMVYLFKKKKKRVIAVLALAISFFLINKTSYATEMVENINVTIPTNISILFDEIGENRISKFEVNNQSLVPITIESIHVIECNDWKLIQKNQEIPVNSKQIVFEIAGECLVAGKNSVSILINENTSELLEINVERGAWTEEVAEETAFQLEIDYAIGKKKFQLHFDANGAAGDLLSQEVYNGDLIDLPSLEREDYVLEGWEDEKGNLYAKQYVMPIGNVTLKAKWKEKMAYAIYSASDTSLRFVRSAEPIETGDIYNGRVVTDVFSGFEDATYTSEKQVPWYDGEQYKKRIITKVVFEDTIRPKSTAYWFCWANNCSSMDMRKLDMSNVTNMAYMCGWTGSEASTFSIIGVDNWDVSNVTDMHYAFRCLGFLSPSLVMDLSKWDVSKVKNMNSMFWGAGYFSTTFSLGDISKWDVSNVTDMDTMLMQAGYTAIWSINLSKWNVNKVTDHDGFSLAIESKITEPNWKY